MPAVTSPRSKLPPSVGRDRPDRRGLRDLQQRVRITRHLEPIVVDVDTAIPLGLITTELLTNAYRYAFPTGSAGFIRVELRLHADIVELTVGDNGYGLPKAKRSPASTGLRLVEALAKQIGGTFAANAEPSMRGTLRFPLRKPAPSYSIRSLCQRSPINSRFR